MFYYCDRLVIKFLAWSKVPTFVFSWKVVMFWFVASCLISLPRLTVLSVLKGNVRIY